MSYLFAAHGGTGHLNPLLAIASRLRDEGAGPSTFVANGPPPMRKWVEDRGFPCAPTRLPFSSLGLALLPRTSGYAETMLAMLSFTSSLDHYAREVERVLNQVQPRCVVADFSFPGVHLAAERCGLPWVSVYHAGLGYPGPGIPPFGSGLPIGGDWGWRGRVYQRLDGWLQGWIRANLRGARRRLGLSPREPELFWSSPFLTLVLTAQGVEAPRDPMDATTFWVGPCLPARGASSDFPSERLSLDRPRIYVSLGTVFNDRPDVYARILNAFSDARHQLVVSAGHAYEALSRRQWPGDVLLFPRVPQLEVLGLVDAVISHGGNNTVNETLSAGKPLLVLPVGGEQGDNASKVVFLGAGLRASTRASSQAIREGVDRLLGEPSFAQRARECAANLARMDGVSTAARFVRRVTETNAPVLRPEGYPVTVERDTPPPWD